MNLLAGRPSPLYTRPKGRLSSFTFRPELPEGYIKIYYVDANDNKIFRALWAQGRWLGEDVVYEHTTYVRDIAFAYVSTSAGTPSPPRLRHFFSEATGAGGGKIYYFDSHNRPVLYYEVQGITWAGNFAFDEDGTLYLSSGNSVPAYLYKVKGGTPRIIYRHPEPIMGFAVRDGKVYFANWHSAIYVLDLATGHVGKLFEDPRFSQLSDVGFRE